MERIDYVVTPGTAGLTQRIDQERDYNVGDKKRNKLDVVKHNRVMPCGQNQY
jgi:hypothetical protein